MAEITDNEAEKAREQYEGLLIELIKEESVEASQRNQDNFDVTCKLFLDRGFSQSDHISWRTKKMVSEMRSLLHERHKAMNPWKYAVDSYEHDTAFDPEPTPSEDFPDLNRQELEVLAAQEFLFQSLGNYPQENDIGAAKQPELASGKNETPVIKQRKGNLVDIETKDLVSSGLSALEVVNHRKEQCRDGIHTDEQLDNDELLIKLSNAVSRAKGTWKKYHDNDLRLPLRISRTIGGRWHKYALTEEGASGAGGGNKYGIIKEEKNS